MRPTCYEDGQLHLRCAGQLQSRSPLRESRAQAGHHTPRPAQLNSGTVLGNGTRERPGVKLARTPPRKSAPHPPGCLELAGQPPAGGVSPGPRITLPPRRDSQR